MAHLLLDQEEEPEIPDLVFPRCEPFEIAIFECRIYDRWGCLILVIPAKTIGECLMIPMPEERVKGTWPFSSANRPKGVALRKTLEAKGTSI